MLGSLRSPLLIGLVVSLVLATLAGCGAETRRAETETEAATTSVPAPPVPTGQPKNVPVAKVTDPHRRAYIAGTDRICRSLDPERSAARKRVGESADIQGAVKAYEKDTALGFSELRKIEAVPPPPGDAALLRANVFEPIRSQLVLRAKIQAALAAVDVPRLRVLRAELDNISRALSAFARGYGWRACGEG
jgi:hypothetical protein